MYLRYTMLFYKFSICINFYVPPVTILLACRRSFESTLRYNSECKIKVTLFLCYKAMLV